MVDLHQALGISFRNFCRAYKSIIKKWQSKLKSSKKDTEADQKLEDTSDAINGTSKDREEDKQEGSRPMNGVRSFRYGGSMRENDPTSFKPRSYDGGFSSLSRNASRRGQNPQPPSSLFRSMSRRSTESMPSRASSGRRSTDSMPSPPLLSKSGSRRSTTPIMFSNSSGVLKPAAIEKQLECTLEELCFGCMKNIKITRDVLSNTGQTMEEEEETLTIKVKPGWKKGTKITFEGTGNERASGSGSSTADITFVIAEKRHPFFRREGDDLELAVEIPLIEALTGCTISVPILGGQSITLTIDDVVCHGYEKIIQGHGMPNPKEPHNRGNLIIKFLVQFPKQLTHQQRSDVCRILQGSFYSS